jgi:hypothetical protein
MTHVTLESIKAAHDNVAAMIAQFEARTATKLITITQQQVELRPGEHYAGVILNEDGAPAHHVILLPGEADEVNWADAKTFAVNAGGELPTRREQALLYANLKAQFESAWYWSSEQHASSDDYAWFQNFFNGNQYNDNKSARLRARAVRRLTIQ